MSSLPSVVYPHQVHPGEKVVTFNDALKMARIELRNALKGAVTGAITNAGHVVGPDEAGDLIRDAVTRAVVHGDIVYDPVGALFDLADQLADAAQSLLAAEEEGSAGDHKSLDPVPAQQTAA